MSVKDWQTMEEAQRDGFVVGCRRTKEQLVVAAQREHWSAPEHIPGAVEAVANQLRIGRPDVGLHYLTWCAGNLWLFHTLKGFDLRRVDERGYLREAGWLALPAPAAPKCLVLMEPGKQCQDPATHAGYEQEGKRCFRHAPETYRPLADVCLTWQAGEHLDDVLARGAAAVKEQAERALFGWFLDQPVDLGRALADLCRPEGGFAEGTIGRVVDDTGMPPMYVTVFGGQMSEATAQRLRRQMENRTQRRTQTLLIDPDPTKSYRPVIDVIRADLRERGYDVVPLLRWEDVASWLAAIGCTVERRHNSVDDPILDGDPALRITKGNPTKDGWMIQSVWPPHLDTILVRLGRVLEVTPEVVREAVLRYATGPVRLALAEKKRVEQVKREVGTASGAGVDPALVNRTGARCPRCLAPAGMIGCSSCSVPGVDPEVVLTKDGSFVNLRRPANIRPGMVFWSPHWLNKGRATMLSPAGSGWWNVAEGGGVVPTTAHRFLGMNPGVPDVDPADVELFGVAAHLRVTPSGDVCDIDEIKKAADEFMTANETRAMFGLPAIDEDRITTARRPESVQRIAGVGADPSRRSGRQSPAVPQVRRFMAEHDRGVLWTSPFLFDAVDTEEVVTDALTRNPELRIVMVLESDAAAKKMIASLTSRLGEQVNQNGAHRLTMKSRAHESRDPSVLCLSVAHAMSGGLVGARVDRFYMVSAITHATAGTEDKRRRMEQWFRANVMGRLTAESRAYIIGPKWNGGDLASVLSNPFGEHRWPWRHMPLTDTVWP